MFIIYFLIAFLTVFLILRRNGAIWRHVLAAVLGVLLVAIPCFFSFVAATINIPAEEFSAVAGFWLLAGIGGVLLAPLLGMLTARISRRRRQRKLAAGQLA